MQKLIFIFLMTCAVVSFGEDSNTAVNNQRNLGTDKPKKRILSPAQLPSEYSRLCQKKDLIGLWKVIQWTPYFHIPAKEWNRPAFMKFQWFVFFDDGKIKSLSAHKEFTIAKVERKLSESKTNIRYDFERKGFLNITSTEKKEVNESWRCALVTKDILEKIMDIDLKKGDLVMSLLSKNNEILYIRQMRKVYDGDVQ